MKTEKRYLSLPLTAQLEITDFCNHKCLHCYNFDSKIENRPTRIVKDEIIMASARKLVDNGIFSVIITGGEPLIKKDLTKKIIRLLKDNDIKVALNSNLTLCDNNFVQFLKEENVRVLTSCPSGIPTSFEKLVGIDNYAKFEENIKKLVAADIHFTINMVVTKDNLMDVRTTAEKMKALGCKSFAATPMGLNMEYPRLDLLLSINDVRQVIRDLIWVEKTLNLNVDILEALPKCVFPEKVLTEKHSFLNRKCQAGRTIIAISCNGDVRPCSHNPVSYGNILEEPLNKIWAKMADWRSEQYVPNECKDCAWLNRCNGGCRTSAKTIGGEWYSKDMYTVGHINASPHTDNAMSKLYAETQLYINTDFRIRQEDDNVFLVYNIEDNICFMVNKVYRDFIVRLKEYDTLSFADLAKQNNVDPNNQSYYNAVLFLIRKGILKII